MVFVPILLIIVGLVVVVLSADEAIKRLANLARYFRLSEFVISIVIGGVIAVLPEMTIGALSAIDGNSSLGFGVIIGANIADLTLVIGAVALYAGRMRLDPNTVKNMRRSLIAVVLPVALFVDGEVSRIDGGILVAAFLIYWIMLLRTKRTESPVVEGRKKTWLLPEFLILLVSLAILFVGATLITDNSEELSLLLGLPLFLIGAIVAVGTCLPELAFALRSIKKQHSELGFGNILGNVLADSMLTIGIIALIHPIRPAFILPPASAGVVMVLSALLVYMLSKDGVLDRKDGILLIFVYALFLALQSVLGSIA